MTDLKELYESLDFQNVKSYIQSGNVLFQYKDYPPSELREKIENKIKEGFGLDVSVIIRTKDEFQKIIENNPFKNDDTNKLYVTFLSETPLKKPIKEIEMKKDVSEKFSIFGKEIYLFIPGGYGRTKLSNDFFEKKLKLSATTRNWKTINRLLEIADNIS
jgi:uncharacterized protein (DUF1697 family)